MIHGLNDGGVCGNLSLDPSCVQCGEELWFSMVVLSGLRGFQSTLR